MKSFLKKLFKGIDHTVNKPLHKDLLDAMRLFVLYLASLSVFSLIWAMIEVIIEKETFLISFVQAFKQPFFSLLLGFTLLIKETKKMNQANNQNARIAFSLFIALLVLFLFFIVDIRRLGIF